MNCILVDDEKPALELLEDNVSRIPFLHIVASCRRPEEVFEVLENNKVDLIFLDINMPRINGLDLIKGIANPPMVILVTAYPEHALDGFNLDVVDYLLKPIPFDRFLRAVNKAQRLHLAQSEKQLQSELDYFFVNANYSSIKIKKFDIICIEGLKDYVRIHLKEGKPIVTRLGLKGLDERLGNDRFLRVHKSYIVALEHIQSIQKTHLTAGSMEIPIGIGYRDLVHEHIKRKSIPT